MSSGTSSSTRHWGRCCCSQGSRTSSKNTVWAHYIDNVGAQFSMVEGSATIADGDMVIGATWRRISKLGVWAYFDRVAAASNPVDGLSRKDFRGPWDRVYTVVMPWEEILATAQRLTFD